ncbi:MAG: chromosome segregation SMC family protein, partial [Trueperaceae bacterium]
MRIERLTVAGFKSFGDRTTLEFAPGVTAVVGPNGSGKSNVLDALRWATGGGRAREFRAGDKTDLIFHGAAGKKRMGRADVEVELIAGERRLKIRRSLDRDGVTKLTLNGRAARFLDLDDELAGSGLGRGSLAVIGQGEVAGVLMADPARLLAYVAEAAGVARQSRRREQTEGRLAAARDHLDRLEERLHADAERIEALRRDADDARKHDELTARARRLRLTLADARVASLRQELHGLESEAARLEADLSDGRAQSTQLRARLVEARDADRAAEAAHRNATAAHARALAEVRIAEHAVEAATTRAADLAAQAERNRAERDAMADRSAPEAPDDDLDRLQAEADASERAHADAAERLEETEARAEAARSERERTDAEATAAERAAAELEARRRGVDAQLRELEADLADAPSGNRHQDAVAGDAGTATSDDPEATEHRAEEALAGADEALDAARRELETAQASHAREAAEARARERAAERQRAAFEARRGYAEGPRHALTSGIDGVLGSVADVLRVPESLHDAVPLALGRRAEYVLVRDAEVARTVLTHVRSRGGWVTLLPLDLVRPSTPRLDPKLAQHEGVLGLASELVDADARYRPVVDQLLGTTALLRTTEQATAIARRFVRRPRLVTLDGDVLEPGGALSGGRPQNRASVVGAAAEFEEAEAQRDQAREQASAAGADVERAQAAFRSARDARDAARERVEAARRTAARWREERAADARLHAERNERRERLQAERRALPEPPAKPPEERVAAAWREERESHDALRLARDAAAPTAAAQA